MKRPFAILSCLLCLFALPCRPLPAATTDLRALVRHVEEQYQGSSAHALLTMQVSTAHWNRTLEMEAWSLRRDDVLVRILAPAKDRGVSTLKVGKEMWNYLPRVDRVIKIPASLMGGSWMGSHLTNDDLVKSSHVDEDYTFRLLEETPAHILIECFPKPEAAVVWGKIVYEINKPQMVPGRIDYFDEARRRVRTIVFDQVRTVDGRPIPLRMTVLPLDKPGEKTVLTYRSLTFGVPLDPGFFSLGRLRKR